jgi:NAD(P)-dependent dehydrogenase (short-subunit alcohol dehydrogenase family)
MGYLDDLFGLQDKVVVVTGANGQLGREICAAFLRAGAKTVGLDVQAVPAALPAENYYQLDVTQKKAINEVFAAIAKKFGAFDVLINNAGVSTFEPFETRPEEKFDWVMDVNLKGPFLCIQEYVGLSDRLNLKPGTIINVASIFGVVSSDFRNYTDCGRKNPEVYGATKAGLILMTKYFAVHLASRRIRVNAVSPGGIYNPANPQGDDFIKNYSSRVPLGRMAKAEEMVGALLYLAGAAASYTTGQNMIVDGGLTCW